MTDENRTEPGPLYKAIGKNIWQFRKAKPLTQKELSAQIGVGQGFITAIENGARRPSIELLLKISDALAVPVDVLLAYDDTQEANDLRHKVAEAYAKLKKLSAPQVDVVIAAIDSVSGENR